MFYLTDKSSFVFYEGTTAAGSPLLLNDEKLGKLYGNHIRSQRKRAGPSCLDWITYGLWVKGCYAESRALVGFYLETIYT